MTLLALLGGCVSAGSGPTERQVAGSTRDIVTASDEGEAAKRARLRLELASAYFAQGQTTTALDEVKQALAADPKSIPAYNLRGLIYASLNEPALADESFRRALQINPEDADTLHNVAWTLCQQRRWAESFTQFRAAIASPASRDPSRSWLALGVCQARSGDLAGAEKSLARAYELDPSNPATAMNLADVLYRRAEFDRARFYVKRVNAVPEFVNAESLWLAARIENRLGNARGVEEYGAQLRQRFPKARETQALERRRFDD
jgi:type IV pilus assembly protein PilF